MNATVNAPCSCPEQWPARECTRHDDGAESYVAPLLLIGGFAVIGYVALGTVAVCACRFAWNAIRSHLGGGL